jgi:hypothetical protein
MNHRHGRLSSRTTTDRRAATQCPLVACPPCVTCSFGLTLINSTHHNPQRPVTTPPPPPRPPGGIGRDLLGVNDTGQLRRGVLSAHQCGMHAVKHAHSIIKGGCPCRQRANAAPLFGEAGRPQVHEWNPVAALLCSMKHQQHRHEGHRHTRCKAWYAGSMQAVRCPKAYVPEAWQRNAPDKQTKHCWPCLCQPCF